MTIANGQAANADDIRKGMTADGEVYHLQDGATASKPAAPGAGDVYVDTDVDGVLASVVAGRFRRIDPHNYARNYTEVDAKVTGPTTLFSFTLKGGDLPVTGCLAIEILGTFTNSSGNNRQPTVTLNFGGEAYTAVLTTIPTGTAGVFRIRAWIHEYADMATQRIIMDVFFPTAANNYQQLVYDTANADVSVDSTVSVTLGWSAQTTTCLSEIATAQVIG